MPLAIMVFFHAEKEKLFDFYNSQILFKLFDLNFKIRKPRKYNAF